VIDEKSIQEAIAYYGGKIDPRRDDAIALAACYILQDHLYPVQTARTVDGSTGYSYAPPPEEKPQATAAPEVVGSYGTSDFLQAVVGKDPAEVWAVMDELMDTLMMVNVRLYNSVLRKIQS